MFRLGYQSPYEPYSGEGDAVYRIDNVHVDMGELSPIYTYPADEAEEVETDEEIKIKWNDEIDAASISESTVLVFKNNTELSESDYDVAICGNILKISFPDGMSYNSEYRVKLQNIESDSLSHTAMSEGYSFSFATKKSFKYDSDCSDEKITVTVIESPVENCICIAAQYGCLGRLLKVETKDCAINEVLEFGNEAGLKIYFWESRESMKPLCEALCY